MAWSQNDIQVQWSLNDTVTVTGGSNSGNSDAVTLTDGPWSRELTVKADAAVPVDGDIIAIYWRPTLDVDDDTTDDVVNQGTYVGSIDVYANDPAVKSFGIHTSLLNGYLYIDAADSTVNVVCSAVISEQVFNAT
jgi:hypothetical protein